jgi:hypothetical protein
VRRLRATTPRATCREGCREPEPTGAHGTMMGGSGDTSKLSLQQPGCRVALRCYGSDGQLRVSLLPDLLQFCRRNGDRLSDAVGAMTGGRE